MKIVAVVVTYNRKQLLAECLNSILSQDCSIDAVVLIDNASTDGTFEYLDETGILDNPVVKYNKMKDNLGGAGGFYNGIKIAMELDPDWVWIMDDDAIPEKECLSRLVDKTEDNISFLASYVYGLNNKPMNIPEIDSRSMDNGYPEWDSRLEEGIIKIRDATFVSLLINANAIKKCGFPCKEYFIWGDDLEYTSRLTTNFGDAYLVGSSKVCHKRANFSSLRLENETDPKRMKNYYYNYRNDYINSYLYKTRKMTALTGLNLVLNSFKMLGTGKHSFKRFKIAISGYIAGITQKKRFRKLIIEQIKNGVEHV